MIFPGARTDEQLAIAESVAAFCAAQRRRAGVSYGVLPYGPELWAGLADLGILGHGASEEGTVRDLVVAAHALAAGGVVAPLPEAFAASRLLGADLGERLAAGGLVVAFAGEGALRWGSLADAVLGFEPGGGAWLAGVEDGSAGGARALAGDGSAPDPAGPGAGVIPFGVPRLAVREPLGPAGAARAVGLAAFAATLCGLGAQVVRDTAAYVRERRQFGRPIGSFQAVGHPLAECHARVSAALDLALSVALRIDRADAEEHPAIERLAESSVLAARRAALRATYAAQQALGGMGYVIEGPMGVLPMVVRELSVGEVARVSVQQQQEVSR